MKFKIIVFLTFFTTFAPLSAEQRSYQFEALKNHKYQRILLVVAMDAEAAPIIKTLKLKPFSRPFTQLPIKSYFGKFKHLEIFLLINGQDPMYKVQNIGTQAATLTTYVGIKSFHPDLVISIGTAGGIKENGANIGDIYASKKIYFYDRRILVVGYAAYGRGGYSSAPLSRIMDKLDIQEGIVCSGDSFDNNKTDMMMLLKYRCNAKEMEAAGVAWVSMLMKVPMIAIKGVTDIVGSKTTLRDFDRNFLKITTKLANRLEAFLNTLAQ
ncbi:hypothetical protein ACQUW5_05845 [Legionella sp. CNM-1927-20]|uniref:phosphorylase family protein n=1 Tax=Legionella sp. CNM-1927-20 TaxID=3422221 RepID=UPI00403B34B8